MHDNLAAVAPQHPDQKCVFFDDELAEPNVMSDKYAQNEGSNLAGALAAFASTDSERFPHPNHRRGSGVPNLGGEFADIDGFEQMRHGVQCMFGIIIGKWLFVRQLVSDGGKFVHCRTGCTLHRQSRMRCQPTINPWP